MQMKEDCSSMPFKDQKMQKNLGGTSSQIPVWEGTSPPRTFKQQQQHKFIAYGSPEAGST